MITCPKCGHEFAQGTPRRICYKCKKPILRSHKWKIIDSHIQHRVCEDPRYYERRTK